MDVRADASVCFFKCVRVCWQLLCELVCCCMDFTRSYCSKSYDNLTAFVHPQAVMGGNAFNRHYPCVSWKELITDLGWILGKISPLCISKISNLFMWVRDCTGVFGIWQINMSFYICEVQSKYNLEPSETQRQPQRWNSIVGTQ